MDEGAEAKRGATADDETASNDPAAADFKNERRLLMTDSSLVSCRMVFVRLRTECVGDRMQHAKSVLKRIPAG
jgi:hypothetical protein